MISWRINIALFVGLVFHSQALFAANESDVEQVASSTASVQLWYRNYDSPHVRALVELAYKKTPEYGHVTIKRSPEMSQGRAVRELTKKRSKLIHIANIASNATREKTLYGIPIPVDGGLLGLRVCVVRKEDLPKFAGVKNLQDLSDRGIRLGQGTHWPDTHILQVNGVHVVTHSRYEILFRMLDNNRFECFARGVSEVLYDLELENNPDYLIEPSLLFAYVMPSYFFVSKSNHDVAQRLQLGMERAIEDGSFATYLDRYYGHAIEELELGSRQVIMLDNPYLTSDSWSVGQKTLQELREKIGSFNNGAPRP